jgi:hypothetical protein
MVSPQGYSPSTSAIEIVGVDKRRPLLAPKLSPPTISWELRSLSASSIPARYRRRPPRACPLTDVKDVIETSLILVTNGSSCTRVALNAFCISDPNFVTGTRRTTADEIVVRLYGANVGINVGTMVGRAEGANVGNEVGTIVGRELGAEVGSKVGDDVGAKDGPDDGAAVGRPVGSSVGIPVGINVGKPVGSAVGSSVGSELGSSVGSALGTSVGD